jgi:transcriptional regulator with XRE-family HTH domain
MKKTFGQLIKKYRKNLRYSQEDVAKLLSLSRTTIADFERAAVKPPAFPLCEKLAFILNINEIEKQDFFHIAAIERLLPNDKNDKPFYSYLLGQEPSSTDIDTLNKNKIPIVEYPKEKITPPYANLTPTGYVSIEQAIATERFYGLYYKEETLVSDKTEFTDGDLIIIDPLFERLKSGSFVLVNIFGNVVIRQYEVLSIHDEVFFQFVPYPPTAEQPFFDPSVDKDKFEIYGKVVMALKMYG